MERYVEVEFADANAGMVTSDSAEGDGIAFSSHSRADGGDDGKGALEAFTFRMPVAAEPTTAGGGASRAVDKAMDVDATLGAVPSVRRVREFTSESAS